MPRKVLIAAAVAFVLKLTLAWNTYGTNDVVFWERHAAKVEKDGALILYRDGTGMDPVQAWNEPFVHPPLAIHVIRLWRTAAVKTSLPFGFWLRFTAALADWGTLYLLAGLAVAELSLVVIALSPVALMVSGFHGNTDSILVFLVVLSIYLASVRGVGPSAATALGMAIGIKVVALLFVPILVLQAKDHRRRAAFLTMLGLAVGISSSPYLWEAPQVVLANVFGYSSRFGAWGIPRITTLLDQLFPPVRFFTLTYFVLGRYVLLAAILAYSWKFRRQEIPLFDRAAGIIPVFLTFTHGFGVQYLAWVIPWTAAFGLRQSIAFHVAATAFLFGVYTFWCGGLPWYFASAVTKGLWPPFLIPFELATWAIIVSMLRSHIRRLSARRPLS